MRARIKNFRHRAIQSIARRLNQWIERDSLGKVDRKIFQFTDCLQTVKAVNKFHKATHLCDIGAHKGRWSYVMHQLNPHLQSVVMFEPQRKLIAELRECELTGVHKTIYDCALADKEDYLMLSGGSASASLFHAAENQHSFFPGSIEDESEMVNVKVLDEIYIENDHPYPDLIKMDVQGYELNVLRGARKVLEEARYLVIEMSLREFYEGQSDLWELWKFLNESNYVMVDRGYELRSRVYPHELLQFDAIFVNRRFVSQ